MAITSARMQQKRGEEVNFDPDKMLPGEWAVSLDTKYVRMCFSPGLCVRMATYEAFEADMAKIQKILEECQTIEEAVTRINTEISEKANAVAEYTKQAKGYRDETKQFRDGAETSATNAKSSEDNAKVSETNAKVSETNAKISEENAQRVAETLPEDYTSLSKAFYNTAIKQKAVGDNIHVTDSADAKQVAFGLYGKAEQNTTSGKNLVEGIDLQCLASDTAEKSITNAVYLTVGTYTLSWVQSATLTGNVTRNTPTIKILGDESSKNYQDTTPKRNLNAGRYYWSFSIKEENDYVFGYWMHSPGVDVTISNIQLESGSVMTDFEPYVGGIASPNPDYPQDIEVAGASYNLLENTAESQTINGVTFTVNDDGSVTANGTATATAILYYIGTASLASKNNFQNMILSGCPSGGSENSYILRVQGFNDESVGQETGHKDDIGNGTVIPNTPYSRLYIRIASGYTANNLTFKPMIRKASVKNNRYMPYGVGSVEVVSCGKNVIDQICVPILDSQSKTHFLKAGVYTIARDSVENGKIWFFGAFDGNGSIITESAMQAQSCSLNGSKEYYYGAENLDTLKITLNVDCYFKVGVLNSLGTSYFMMSKGDKYEPYEPYTETTSTIPTPNGLCGIKVSSGGNYTDENGQQWICDEVVKYADGSGKRIQRFINAVSEGVELVRHSLTSDNYFVAYMHNTGVPEVPTKVLSTHFIKTNEASALSTSAGLYMAGNVNPVHISVPVSIANDTATLKQWLLDNDVKIYYALAEPIITDLTAEEIAEIEKLHTSYPITNISNDSDCGMAVTYMADAKNYIDNRLALIESAMLNNI